MIIEIVIRAEVVFVQDLVDTSAAFAAKHLFPHGHMLVIAGIATMIAEGQDICFFRLHVA
jgi:hypothetical protein